MQDAPLYSQIARGPENGAAHWVTTDDGLRIRVAHWTASAAKGTVLIFPGRTEYIEKYGPLAQQIVARGFCAVAVDWRGQGLAGRTHPNAAYGDVGAFTDYQRDVAALIDHARALKLPEPFFLLGHSMGGCIGLRALIEGLPVNAAAFSAPMWGIEMDAVTRPFAWTLSTISRYLGFEKRLAPGQELDAYVGRTTFADNTLTSDPDMFAFLQEQMRAQPDLSLGGPSLRWLNEALRETKALSRMPSPQIRCITFLGSDEEIVDPSRIRSRMSAWPQGTLQMFEGAKHEVMMETPAIRNEATDAMLSLFERHC